MSRARRGHGGIALEALKRELRHSPSAKAGAEDAFNYIAEHAVVPLAAKLCARRGVGPDQVLEDICDMFDVFVTLMRDRYDCVDFADGHSERFLDPVYDDQHADRQRLVDRIYQATAAERRKMAPELELGAPAETSGRNSDGPTS